MYNIYMDKKISEKKRFSIISRIKSTNNAFRGFLILFKTTPNFWLQIFFSVLALYMGFMFQISSVEWLFVVLAIAIIFISEMFNTAIEIDIDLTSPNYHPYARDIKDISAGAVLLSAFFAGVIGLIIFLPKVINLFV